MVGLCLTIYRPSPALMSGDWWTWNYMVWWRISSFSKTLPPSTLQRKAFNSKWYSLNSGGCFNVTMCASTSKLQLLLIFVSLRSATARRADVYMTKQYSGVLSACAMLNIPILYLVIKLKGKVHQYNCGFDYLTYLWSLPLYLIVL